MICGKRSPQSKSTAIGGLRFLGPICIGHQLAQAGVAHRQDLTGFPDIRVRGHVGFSQGNRVAICLFRRRTIAEQTLDVTDHAQRASLVLSAGGINRFVLDHLLVETEQILQELRKLDIRRKKQETDELLQRLQKGALSKEEHVRYGTMIAEIKQLEQKLASDGQT